MNWVTSPDILSYGFIWTRSNWVYHYDKLHNIIYRDTFYFIDNSGIDKIARNTIWVIQHLLQLDNGFLMVLSNLVTYSSPRVKLVFRWKWLYVIYQKKTILKITGAIRDAFQTTFYGIFDDYCRKLRVIIHH